MIELLRIDERLIHGQVANQWARQLNVDAIVVANDAAATNDLVKASLKMAAPQGKKVVVKKVEDAIKTLNDPRANNMSIFVVVDNPSDCLKIVENVKGVPYVNVGNFGRVGFDKAQRKEYTSCLYANDQEVEIFKKIMATGIECECRILPSDVKTSLASVLK